MLNVPFLLLLTSQSVFASSQDSPDLGTPWLFPGLAVFSFVWAFADAYGIGANDVANSFATSVASGTITHRQAIFIALFAEFFGALVLGSSVTETIKKKVIATERFVHDPYILMLAMACTSMGSAIWVLLATYFQMPVSTTHATVGAIMGVGISAFGLSGVLWDFNQGGFFSIMASWFLSPFIAGLLSAIFYLSIKVFILEAGDTSFQRGLAALPVYFAFTWGTICGFMMLKGSPALGLDKLPLGTSVTAIMAVAASGAAFGRACAAPWCRRVVGHGELIPWYKMFIIWRIPPSYPRAVLSNGREAELPRSASIEEDTSIGEEEVRVACKREAERDGLVATDSLTYRAGGESGDSRPTTILPSLAASAGAGRGAAGGLDGTAGQILGLLMVDVSSDIEESDLHRNVKRYDPRTEELFKLLQVSTCSFASLAHGANDVANAIGPLATVWMVFSTGKVSTAASVPAWLMLYGAVALDLGLLTYGHHIMRALGNKITYHSPSRGFCMELGAMFTVLTFSKLGVPISTTHCICGATAAVGLCGGHLSAVNWRMVATIIFGWILTCPAAGLMAGLLFVFVGSSPRPVPGNGFFEF